MSKYLSPIYYLTVIVFVLLLFGKLGIYLSKKFFRSFFKPKLSFFTPFGLLFFLKNYLVIFGIIFLGTNIYIYGIKATFKEGPPSLFAQEEYVPEIPYEEVHDLPPIEEDNSEFELPLVEESNYAYPDTSYKQSFESYLPPAPEETTYAYPEPIYEQSLPEVALPEIPPNPVYAYQEPQYDQSPPEVALPVVDDSYQYAYTPPTYQQDLFEVNLPQTEDPIVYAYQEPIMEQPVAEIPQHTDMNMNPDQVYHQSDMSPSMTMTPNDSIHQMPIMDPYLMNGNGAMIMDTPHQPNNSLLMENNEHQNMPIISNNPSVMPDHNDIPSMSMPTTSMPSMGDMGHPTITNQGMDMTSAAQHQMMLPAGQMQTVMIGHDGSATMTIPSVTHDQMNGNMNMGPSTMTNHSGMGISDHSNTQTTGHENMNMGSTQMTIPTNHTDMSNPTHTMAMTNSQTGMAMTAFGTSTMTDHNIMTMPTSTNLTSMTEHSTLHTTSTTAGSPMAMDMSNHQMTQTSNPTYNAFHNTHQTATPTSSETHDQHTLTATLPSNQVALTDHSHTNTTTGNNTVMAATHENHNSSTTPSNSTTSTIQPITSANHQHDGMQMNDTSHPVVVASANINIKELPRTGVSALVLLLATILPFGIFYLKRNKYSTENITAISIWSEKQLKM